MGEMKKSEFTTRMDAGRRNMKKTVVAALIAICCVPSATFAGERVGDAALGALSGAVVLGPVGAVAGAVIGYTAGPSIAVWAVTPRVSLSRANVRGPFFLLWSPPLRFQKRQGNFPADRFDKRGKSPISMA